MGLHECEIVHHRTVSTTVPVASCRGVSWDSSIARPFTTKLFPPLWTLVGLHECETIPPDQNCVHVPRLSWDSMSAKDVSPDQNCIHVPRLSWDSTSATNPVVTGNEHFPRNTRPKTDQNCAGLMRAERHVTRRDVVSSQTEVNSVSVVEAVHRVDRLSHKILQVHQWGKTPYTAYNVGMPARLRTIRPKPIDILAVGTVTHRVCLQNLKAGAAHVIMNDDTETGRL